MFENNMLAKPNPTRIIFLSSFSIIMTRRKFFKVIIMKNEDRLLLNTNRKL